ncbi:beta-lactamase/transpeptidase-like protein [Aspergillus foveolatus]|uniref:beta-lactamase/transpeptidase-like protein n=1 Tax=Aspergillus foveolatus TaxID=210207 RepID=UPI003CCCEACC
MSVMRAAVAGTSKARLAVARGRGIRSPYSYSLMRRILLLSALAAHAAQIKICPLGGPVFPAAQRPGESAAMKQATRDFTESLHEILYPVNVSLTAAIDPDLTSFAVQVYSARDPKPLFEYYHTATSARNNTLGVNGIDGDTVFRIGSCSKIWTVLLLLMETGEALFHEPVWKYLPEVENAIEELGGGLNEIDHVHWKDVTIGDLVSQTAGLERSYGLGDHAATTAPMEGLGFPPLQQKEVPECSLEPSCDRERKTGGIYSSTKDMSVLGRAILNSELLSPTLTRQWLKPRAHTADPAFSVGAPWEIFTLSEPRMIDLYTKSGDLGSYSSMMGLSPEHDVGFTVLAAGQKTHNAVWALGDLISTIVIPALDAAGKEEASFRFAGTYASGNDALTIITDAGPGLKVTKWSSNGKDLLESMKMLQWGGPYEDIDVRLYPTGLKSPAQPGRSTQIMVSFRSVVSYPIPVGAGPMTRTCLTWLTVDGQVYGSVGIDEFVFHVGEDGDAVRVSPRVLRTSLDRVRQ